MSPELLQKLQELGDSIGIREAILELCRPYGEIVRLEIESDGDGGHICLVDLATITQNIALSREVGGFSYGRGVGFLIPAKRSG